ncbi:unnamed protein product [Alopecurus aequalis]
MPRRRRSQAGAAGSGSVSGSMVPMAPSSREAASEGRGSTGEMASSGAAPVVHPGKGPAGTGWIQENPNKKAATASSGGVPTVHPGKGAAGSIWSGAVALPEREAARAVSDSSVMVPMAQSRGEAMVHTGEDGDMQQKNAAMTSSRGAPMNHPGKGATGSGSNGALLQDKVAAALSRGALLAHSGKAAAGSGSSGTMLQKKADVASREGTAHHDKVVTSSVPTGGMPQKVAADSSGGMQTTLPVKAKVGMGLCEELAQKNATALSGEYPALGALDMKAAVASCGGTANHDKVVTSSVPTGGMTQKVAAASSGGMQKTLPVKGEVGMGLCEELPQKNVMALSGEYAALGALERNTTSHDCEKSAAEHSAKKGHTLTRAKIPQKNCTEDKAADMGLSGGMLQKQSSKMEVDIKHPAMESDTAKDIQDSDCNKIVHIKDESIHEVECLIQNLNDLGKGEDISNEEFLGYYKRLCSKVSRWIDLTVCLEDEELDEQENRHALYRLRYYKHKFKQQTSSKEELHDDKTKEDRHLIILHKSEDDCNEEFLEEDLYYDKLKEDRHQRLLHKSEDDCNDEFLEEEGFFKGFEEETTFDWFFHPDYLGCPSLSDYQCLVLKNYGGTEYTRWSEYHKYLNSYEIELEYVKYFVELSKQLKWMEDYVDTHGPSVKWSKISSRGAYQAFKIAATSFHKITPSLAYNAYFECKESMVYDYTFFKELDGVYFEIWRRITHERRSFKEALEEVYNLNRFPSRQRIMKAALEFDDTMKRMEAKVEDKAQELIEEAVKKQVNKPKSYAQYIRKKMDIARIIGILNSEES